MSPKLARRRPSPALVIALIALFVALGGPATAARLIDGGSIRSGTVTSKQIKNRSLQEADLSRRAVAALRQTPYRGVTRGRVAPGAIDASRLADGAVVGPKIAGSAVGPAQIAMGAVTSTKLADGSVGSTAIANGSLTAADVGQFVGAVSLTFPTFTPGTCWASTAFTPTPSGGGSPNPADDVFVVTPAAGWPDPLIVSAKPVVGGQLKLVACYVPPPGAGPPDITAPANQVFRYVSFDAP